MHPSTQNPPYKVYKVPQRLIVATPGTLTVPFLSAPDTELLDHPDVWWGYPTYPLQCYLLRTKIYCHSIIIGSDQNRLSDQTRRHRISVSIESNSK
jgi:hypothetical protein